MKTWTLGLAALALSLTPAHAADHNDGSGTALADPSTDITDVYAWMSSDTTASTGKVNLVMDVFPNATHDSLFSTVTNYVFHTASQAGLTAASNVRRDVVCRFDGTSAPQTASCWVVDPTAHDATEYANGNATSATAPLTSVSQRMKVFAGPRNDPFFFNLAGFKNATSTVAAAVKDFKASGTTYIASVDANGCPALRSGARGAVVQYLSKDCTGTGTAKDAFQAMQPNANAACVTKPATVTTASSNEALSGNVLSIVLTIDKSLLTTGGTTLSVWGATTL